MESRGELEFSAFLTLPFKGKEAREFLHRLRAQLRSE
jgi:hypothetical protein